MAAVADVFDRYRRHYGELVVPGQALTWLTRQTATGALSVFAAHIGHGLAGVATTVALPASLRLGCYWQLRDLYVVPEARRCGVARALVKDVRAAASAAGAIRLSVQTEPDNAAALQLYRSSGFIPVEGIQILALDLPPNGR